MLRLGTEPMASGRTACTLTSCTIFPAPKHFTVVWHYVRLRVQLSISAFELVALL